MQTPNYKLTTPNSPTRCSWAGSDPLYQKYHDEEWGKPVYDDKILFEFLILEGAQAGLSWITILRRRENYRKAFANFEVREVAAFDEEDVDILMNDVGIIRNKLKVNGAITNAKLFIEIQKEFGTFSNYLALYARGRAASKSNSNHERCSGTDRNI